MSDEKITDNDLAKWINADGALEVTEEMIEAAEETDNEYVERIIKSVKAKGAKR